MPEPQSNAPGQAVAVEPVTPEPVVEQVEGYDPDAWNYPRRCADVELALAATRERIEEWDRTADPHGWWHERPHLIALYNEVVRLRAEDESAP